jgi:hypothetical protein
VQVLSSCEHSGHNRLGPLHCGVELHKRMLYFSLVFCVFFYLILNCGGNLYHVLCFVNLNFVTFCAVVLFVDCCVSTEQC